MKKINLFVLCSVLVLLTGCGADSQVVVVSTLPFRYVQSVLELDSPVIYNNGAAEVIDGDNTLYARPLILDDACFVPLETLPLLFATSARYYNETGVIKIDNGKYLALEMIVGDIEYTEKIGNVEVGEIKTLTAAPIARNGAVYIPLRFVMNYADCDITLDVATNQILCQSREVAMTPEIADIITKTTTDSRRAVELSLATERLCMHDKSFYQMHDFSTKVLIDFNSLTPYLEEGVDYTTVLTGTAPWIVYVEEGEYVVTDSGVPATVYFRCYWSDLADASPSPSASAVAAEVFYENAETEGETE